MTKMRYRGIALIFVLLFLPLYTAQKVQHHPKIKAVLQSKVIDDDSIRLPDSLIPSHYFIRLQPFINGNLSFSGYVEITFMVKKVTNKIIIHINDIVTKNDTVKVEPLSKNLEIPSIERHDFDQKRQMYIATLKKDLQEGEIYTLSMSYQGYLNDDLKGFYRSSYKDQNGKTIMLAATQFEPTDARKAFPCFDEPQMKAKFTIEMIREEGLRTISNMPRFQSIPHTEDGWYVDRFNTSFPMSTYLVAFIVSDFACLQSNDTEHYKYDFRVWARKNAISRLQYAIKIGPPISKFYEEYFDVPFPLPKQDMAAVPDFSAGGMENWGLVTYRESAFLYDEKVAKASQRMRIASVISHELAHQWFGDLVTPKWWTDIWLNEGFASYMEYLALVGVEPSLKPMEQFIIKEVHPVLKLDSLVNSHPISIVVRNPDEINEIFDGISYSKGGSILAMISSFLTERSFRRGLNKYLTEFSYSNAEQDDLWRYLTHQAHEDGTLDKDLTVKDIMDTWTLQMGYPLITVQRDSKGYAELKQERYLSSSRKNSSKHHDYKWWVPITFTTENDPNFEISQPSEWMKPTEATKVITDIPSEDKWIILNKAQTGYYRVTYDKNNWNQIIRQLNTDNTVISDTNKAQIIDDSMNLARSGDVEYTIALKILSYLKNESSYIPIKAALENLEFIRKMYEYTGGYGVLKSYLLSFIVPLYEKVQFTDKLTDPHLVQLKRSEIISWACKLGYKSCVSNATALYQKWMNDPQNSKLISPNLKSIVYCTGISEGGIKEWNFAWKKYIKTNVGTEQKELLQALGCTRSVWILNEFLNRTLSPSEGIKKQMVRYIIPALAQTEIGRFVAWKFIRSRWNDVVNYFGSVSFVLDEILSAVTEGLNTELNLEEIKTFKANNEGNLSSGKRSVDQAIEHTENNIQWMESNYYFIKNYLENENFHGELLS